MHLLSTSQLLRLWELGPTQPPLQWALTLLATAWSDTTADAIADLSIGQRNHRLLRLRAATFGQPLACFATCPRCGETVELAFDVADITVDPGPEPPRSVFVQCAPYEVEAYIPTTRDVLAAWGGDVETIRQRLLDRCIATAQTNGEPVAAGDLPDEIMAAIVSRIAEADAQAEIRLSLTCPACGGAWEELFDILSYFWSEIDAWAHRLLRDVHDLASAYGWREADILEMSSVRRRRYLEMVGA